MKLSLKFRFIRIVLIAALAINLLVLIFRFSLTFLLKKIIIDRDDSQIYLVTGTDKLLAAMNIKSNLFISFSGFDDEYKSKWGGPADVASIIYFRIAYFLYPKKVYASREEKKIVRGTEFLYEKFQPDQEWLKKHNVSDILYLNRSPDGSISFEFQNLNE